MELTNTGWVMKRLYPTGTYVDMLKPHEADIHIEDIAWSLGMQCRFGGCVAEFYSVAQHSVFVSNMLPRELAFQGLMHDAHEAYVQDINTGLKQSLGQPFMTLDDAWSDKVRMHFGLPKKLDPQVKRADLIALATERRDLGLGDDVVWPTLRGLQPADGILTPLPPRRAIELFLQTYYKFNSEGMPK